MRASLSEIIKHKVLPGHETCSYIERVSLTECTQEAHSPQTGFQHIVPSPWSNVDAQTDANSVASSTIAVVSKTASIASHRSQTFLHEIPIAKTEMCTM